MRLDWSHHLGELLLCLLAELRRELVRPLGKTHGILLYLVGDLRRRLLGLLLLPIARLCSVIFITRHL